MTTTNWIWTLFCGSPELWNKLPALDWREKQVSW